MSKAEYPGNRGCPQRDSAEYEEYAGARSIDRRGTEESDGADLLERILDRDNLNRAYTRVKANKGAPGIDGMTVEDALPWLIVAKKAQPDSEGVRIAELDEQRYKELLWDHRPLTDFWMIGHGTEARLARIGISTMGELARMSLYDQKTLYKIFGVDCELLVDHAWGLESVTMRDIKSYRPSSTSISSGQVLARPYSFSEARVIIAEMVEGVVLELVEKGLTCEAMALHVGFDRENCERGGYSGAVKTDWYGRSVPVSAHGTASFGGPTSSTARILEAVLALYDKIVDRKLTSRRLNVAAIRVEKESDIPVQFDLFADYEREEREKYLQRTMIQMHRKYGGNALLRGHDLLDGATIRERNQQIGGHHV